MITNDGIPDNFVSIHLINMSGTGLRQYNAREGHNDAPMIYWKPISQVVITTTYGTVTDDKLVRYGNFQFSTYFVKEPLFYVMTGGGVLYVALINLNFSMGVK